MVLVLAEFQAASKPGKATLMVRQLCLIFSYFSFSLSLPLGFLNYSIGGFHASKTAFYTPKFWDF